MHEYILGNSEKEMLGKLIEIRRKKLCKETTSIPNPYTISNFIMGESGKIVDEKTYRKIRSGIAINDDEVYDELLDKLGVEFYKNINLGNELRRIIHEIYNAVYYVDEDKLNEEYQKTEELLNDCRGYIVYDELNYLIEVIQDYALANQYLSEEQYKELEQYIGVFGREIDEMVLYILNRYNGTYMNTFEEILEWQKKYILLFEKSYLIKPFYISSLVNLGNMEKSKKIIDDCFRVYKKQKNLSRYIQVKEYELKIILKNNHRIHEFINDFLNRIDNYEVKNEYFVGSRYFSMATQLMARKYYKESIVMLKKAEEFYKGSVDRVYIYMQYCYDCLERNSFKIITSLKEENERNILWNYYAMRNSGESIEKLEKYIQKSVMKSKMLEQYQYYMIMKREIYELVKVNKHYSMYYSYVSEYFDNEF